jgi:hypothetical protein
MLHHSLLFSKPGDAVTGVEQAVTEQLRRPSSLRTFLEAGCDVMSIPRVERYALVICVACRQRLAELAERAAIELEEQVKVDELDDELHGLDQ